MLSHRFEMRPLALANSGENVRVWWGDDVDRRTDAASVRRTLLVGQLALMVVFAGMFALAGLVVLRALGLV